MVTSIMFLSVLTVYLLGVGLIYLPMKRASGVLLSGVTIHLLVASLIPLALAAILVLVDHYDPARNRAFYRPKEILLLKTSGILLGASLLIAIVHAFLDPDSACHLPESRGFFTRTFLQDLLETPPLPVPLRKWGRNLAVVSLLLIVVFGLLARFAKRWESIGMGIAGLGTSLMGGALFAHLIHETSIGEASIGATYHRCEILLRDSPHAFLAIQATKLAGCLLLLVAGGLILATALRISQAQPPSRRRKRRPGGPA